MSIFADTALRIAVAITEVAPTPAPQPGYTGDEDLITPGWIGFSAMFVIALATILLILDMTRRIRRTRYRDEIRAKLEGEAGATPPTAP